MEVYIRKRRSRPPFEVIAALVVLFVVGFGVCYYVFGRGESETAPPDDSQIAAVPPAPSSAEPISPPSEEPPSEEPTATTEPAPTEPAPTEPTAPQPTEELAKVEDVWPARHLFIAVKGEKLDRATSEMLAVLKPGGVVLRSENIRERKQVIDLVGEIKAAVGLGTTIEKLPLIAVAQEGGALNVLRLKEAPTASKIGADKNLEEAKGAGAALGQSMLERGIGVLLAPMLDVSGKNTPKEMQSRSFGENHNEVAAIGLAYADGVVGAGVLPVVKFFPGMATIKGDTQKTVATLADDQDRFAEIIYPFSEAARCNVPGILVGHVIVPSVDKETKPVAAASLSSKFLKALLREKWGFPGVILADDLNKSSMTKQLPVEQSAIAALAAGNDAVLMLNPDVEKIKLVCANIEKAATEGKLDRVALSNSKKRLDAWCAALEKPRTGLDGPLPQLPSPEAAAAQATENATAPAATDTPAPGAEIEHTVASGETLSKLATKYKVTAGEIREWNQLKSDNLFVGQKLIIKTAAPAPEQPSAPAAETTPPPVPAEPAPAPAATEPAPSESAAMDPPSEEPSVQPPANSKAVEYVVKSGDFLSSIATKHKVKYQDIMTWNHLNDTNLSSGQKLTIYVPADFVAPGETAPADAPKDEAPKANAPAAAEPAPQEDTAAAPGTDTEISYTVKKGDNLANIGAAYGVTADDIRGWNGIEGNRIDVGQALKIRPKKMPTE
ncbi:MAG: LysM peptidoglycan-binding domain-containing protein [Candidatus Hydrogenedentes bacterium]|nr:LysM peptidoglycan-binding domain-containing protein [Candidatus Hydrogenedentota bacterium]